MEPEKLLEEIKKLGAVIDSVRHDLDEAVKVNVGTGELKSAEERILKEFTGKFMDLETAKKMAARMDEIETTATMTAEQQAVAGVKPSAHRAATRDMLRTACNWEDSGVALKKETVEFFASDEYRKFAGNVAVEHTLTEAVGTAGGIFLDPVIEAGILKNYVSIDDVRSVASIRVITAADRVKGYRRKGRPTAYHENETGSGTESESAWTDYEIPVHPMIVKTPVSGDLLADVSYIESEIMADAGEAFSYTEGNDFVEGSGVHMARGFINGVGTDDTRFANAVSSTVVAGANAINADDIPSMWGTLPQPYRGTSTWAFNSTTFISLLSLVDSNKRHYLIQDGGLVAGPPNQIYGRPFKIFDSLPDEGSDAYPLYLCDFKFYRIIDRSGIQLQRDPFTAWPKIVFKMRKRSGGQIIKAEAFLALLTT